MIKIISAFYGTFIINKDDMGNIQIKGEYKIDVSEIIRNNIKNNQLEIHVGNHIFTDPNNGVIKELYVKYEYDNILYESIVNEGEIFKISKNNKNDYPFIKKLTVDDKNVDYNNILLLTSCNRIKQVLLSLSLNLQIIKGNINGSGF
jgi:hypothetical protein